MAFNKENKITWEELSPSLQELFKGLQTQITKETQERIIADNKLRTDLNKETADRIAADNQLRSDLNKETADRIAADNQLRADLNKETADRIEVDDDLYNKLANLAKQVDLARGAAFKSWMIRLWENHHIFTDLSFYETHDVQQSGSTNKITDKQYNCIFGIMYGQITINGEHPGWIKHQQPFTGPDGVRRIYLGCGIGISGGASVYRSDDQGLVFDKVATLGGRAIWDFCDASSIGAGLLAITYDPYAIFRSTDGVNWAQVATPPGDVKTLSLYNGRILCVCNGTTLYSTNGVNWSSHSPNGMNAGYSYSRYAGEKVYIGTADPSKIFVSTDANGFNYTVLRYPDGSEYSGGETYIRWICSWKPKGYTSELIVWGTGNTETGESGAIGGGANLWCYDPSDNTISLLYSFNGRNDGNKTAGALNYGHAPLEPMMSNGAGGYKMTGFRDAQIRYIEPFVNDYTGETFLLVGTSDNHFYSAYSNTTLYYQNHDYDTHISTPLVSDSGVKVEWTNIDKEAWKLTDQNHFGSDQYGPYMGNVYAVSPRGNTFKKDDLCIALIKHTEDTRVYSMSVFTDPQNVKWAYAGTGGGNYSGKGLLYRFGYSDMLNLIQAAKIGAIFPPRWKRLGTGSEGVNTRLLQEASRAYIKVMGGVSAREDYAEIKFAFNKVFLKSSGTDSDPYIRLIFNHQDSANYYCITYYPLNNSVVCERFINNIPYSIININNSTSYDPGQYEIWKTTNVEEGSSAPLMGPYYILAAKVNPGAVNPNSQTSEDYYLHNSLDGTIDFYFKKSQNRQDKCTDGDRIASYTINYSGGERKHIGNYGLESFDINGLVFISMQQMSLARYNKDAMEVGEIVFTVS